VPIVYIVALVFVELAVKAPLYLRRRGRLHRSGAAPARARPRRAEQVHEQHACNRGHPSGADPGYEVVHDKEAARMQLLVEPAPYGETEAWAYVQLGWRLALLCLHAEGQTACPAGASCPRQHLIGCLLLLRLRRHALPVPAGAWSPYRTMHAVASIFFYFAVHASLHTSCLCQRQQVGKNKNH
jgi:hypothetical protein